MSLPPTQYSRELLRAQQVIQKRGVKVSWIKQPIVEDGSPFPANDTPVAYDVYMVFYPQNRASYSTNILDALTENPKLSLFAVMAGGLPFTPELHDDITLPTGVVIRVEYFNVTQPDLTPIVYELGFE